LRWGQLNSIGGLGIGLVSIIPLLLMLNLLAQIVHMFSWARR